MNRFCKTFFGVFFAFVATMMLLLGYGLSVQLHGLMQGNEGSFRELTQISTESICQSHENLLYWF